MWATWRLRGGDNVQTESGQARRRNIVFEEHCFSPPLHTLVSPWLLPMGRDAVTGSRSLKKEGSWQDSFGSPWLQSPLLLLALDFSLLTRHPPRASSQVLTALGERPWQASSPGTHGLREMSLEQKMTGVGEGGCGQVIVTVLCSLVSWHFPLSQAANSLSETKQCDTVEAKKACQSLSLVFPNYKLSMFPGKLRGSME